MVYDDQKFVGVDFSTQKLDGVEYSGCIFKGCSFASIVIGNVEFLDCTFDGCNFTQIKLKGTGIKDTTFKDCKMLGVDFSGASKFLFTAAFVDCMLDYSIFISKDLRGFGFNGCSLKSVVFEDCNLTKVRFGDCNLVDASFIGSNLTQSDFTTVTGLTLDPTQNKVKGARFSYPAVLALLERFEIIVE